MFRVCGCGFSFIVVFAVCAYNVATSCRVVLACLRAVYYCSFMYWLAVLCGIAPLSCCIVLLCVWCRVFSSFVLVLLYWFSALCYCLVAVT